MAIVEIVFDKSKKNREILTITRSGISFSSAFIKNQNLQQKQSIKFYKDDANDYWLGFDFLDDTLAANSLALQSAAVHGKIAFTRTVKAAKLFAESPMLHSIKNSPYKTNRNFEIKKDKVNGKYYIMLCPTFEKSVEFNDRNSIDATIQGIYRYLDNNNTIVYIGKGYIRDRANSTDRKNWLIKTIEYSSLETEADCFKWEAFYLKEHQSQFGSLPKFNQIKGHSVD